MQLCKVLAISADEAELLLSSSAFVLEQAAWAAVSPEKLVSELFAAGMAETQAAAFGRAWGEGAATCLEELKQRSVIAVQRLESINWELGVTTASSSSVRTHEAQSVLQLGLSKPAPAGQPNDLKSLHIKFTEAGMRSFLDRLDTVQSQIDRLS